MKRHPDGTLHFSDLKLFSLSAAHYAYAIEHAGEREVTPAMRMGILVDRLLLTPERPPMVAGEDRRSLEYKALRAGTPPEEEVFTNPELARAMVAVEAVRRDAVARDYLGLDDPERRTQVPLRWELQGVARSTRGLDVLSRNRVVDLKFTQTANPYRFASQARRMGWHAQLADYVEACAQNGIDTSGGAFLVGVEARPPYPVTVLRMTPEALDEGRRMLASWIEDYKACELADAWPGYVQAPVDLEIALLGDEAPELVFPDDAAA
jgi:hypothetical protein